MDIWTVDIHQRANRQTTTNTHILYQRVIQSLQSSWFACTWKVGGNVSISKDKDFLGGFQ